MHAQAFLSTISDLGTLALTTLDAGLAVRAENAALLADTDAANHLRVLPADGHAVCAVQTQSACLCHASVDEVPPGQAFW